MCLISFPARVGILMVSIKFELEAMNGKKTSIHFVSIHGMVASTDTSRSTTQLGRIFPVDRP